MYKLIEKYIANITENDIYEFGVKNNIILDKSDISILYHYLKENYQDILKENLDQEVLNKLKAKEDILNLYGFYFNKYKEYLK